MNILAVQKNCAHFSLLLHHLCNRVHTYLKPEVLHFLLFIYLDHFNALQGHSD